MLQNIDIMIVDLQDIGTRVYTFIQTVYLVIEACKERGIPVYVLDRPNPIGSTTAGAILDPDYFSFVGLTSLPMQHGMTIGELSHRYGRQLNADVHVIKMSGWNRTGFFDETGLPWVMPSPNMPSLDTAIVYPGTVLIEGTNLSEGRGTTRPFEIIGAPDIDPNSIADELNSLKLPGTHFRPVQFEPVHQKYVEQLCGGVHIHVTDRSKFEAVRTGIAVLLTMKRHDRKFKWLEPPYEYEKEKMPIDILSGSAQLREMVNDNSELHEFDTWLNCGITGFLEDRKQDLLY